MVDADMPINIKVAGLIGISFHPSLAEFLHPRFRLTMAGHMRDLFSQCSHFRHAVKSDDLAEFTWRNMSQTFWAANAPQCHETQQQENMQTAIKPLGQLQILSYPTEKPIGT